MSIDVCHCCNSYVDSDFDGDCYEPDPRYSLAGFPDICICERCREKRQIDDDMAEANAALAQAEQERT